MHGKHKWVLESTSAQRSPEDHSSCSVITVSEGLVRNLDGQDRPGYSHARSFSFLGNAAPMGLFPCAEVDSVIAPKALSGQIHSQGCEFIFPAHMASAR